MNCEKCGRVIVPSVHYRSSFWDLFYVDLGCVGGRCPDGEHLHHQCPECAYAWIAPVAGQALGEPFRKQPPPGSIVEQPHKDTATRGRIQAVIRALTWWRR